MNANIPLAILAILIIMLGSLFFISAEVKPIDSNSPVHKSDLTKRLKPIGECLN